LKGFNNEPLCYDTGTVSTCSGDRTADSWYSSFGSGVRQTFTSSGNYVSDGKPIRVYVIGAAGGNGSTKNGRWRVCHGHYSPPVGNISVVIGAKGLLSDGGTSSFGATDILITALGGSRGTDMGSGGDGGRAASLVPA
jgi:hypothetical protein